jgi:hypothetical protein
LDQILESIDLVFSRLTDVGVQQLLMKKQIEANTQTLGKHKTDQQLMAQQIAATGQAGAKLTVEQFKYEESQHN